MAIALSFDVFAVAVSNGISLKRLQIKNSFKIAFTFAVFHFCMFIIGWFAGFTIKRYILNLDHWIAFILLSFVGIKMIYESFQFKDTGNKINNNVITLLTLSIATSIDALTVGISFVFLRILILVPALIIGTITFIAALLGFYLGKKIGHFFEKIGRAHV